MKTIAILMLMAAGAVASEVPAEAAKLVEIREREINRINLAYLKKLDALLVGYRANGDTAAVAAVERLVAAVEGSPAPSFKVHDDPMSPLVGVWQRDSDKRLFNIPDSAGGTFNGNQKFQMTWDPEKKRAVVVSDQWVNYLWPSTDPDILNGSFDNGGRTARYRLKRVQ